MDAHTPGQAPAADDQELANVLAGISQDPNAPANADSGLQFEETPAPAPVQDNDAPVISDEPVAVDEPAVPTIELPDLDAPLPTPVIDTPAVSNTTAVASPELEGIKKDALAELRPLVDKLNLPADEKFDTLLLIIRSTDDQTLLGEAHDAAKSIEDESKRASALLDIIKEIDYFANQK